MSERELVHQSQRFTAKDRNLAAGLQQTTPTQFVELLAAGRVSQDSGGDDGMRNASTRLPEQGLERRPLLRTSSPLKTKNQPRTHIGIGKAKGGTSTGQFAHACSWHKSKSGDRPSLARPCLSLFLARRLGMRFVVYGRKPILRGQEKRILLYI
jgi:hypothetical protein